MKDKPVWVSGHKVATWLVIGLALSLVLLPPQARAAFLTSRAFLNANDSQQRHEDLSRIQRFLESKIIHQRLKDLGLAEAEIVNRLNELTDEQVHQLTAQIDALIPGGDALGGAVFILLVLLLVVLALQMTGHKVIITK